MGIFRVRAKMGFLYWLLEVILAFLFLFVEYILHFVWNVVPRGRLKYFIMGTNKNANLNSNGDFVDLASSNGYVIEEHYVHTKDGYILGIHRLPPRIAESSDKENRVIFIQHGFMQNSEAFIARGPKKSLPYLLVDKGYDVWLGNNRGNKYSHKHLSISTKDEKFWDFCLDDLALSDIPSMIEYVLQYTGTAKLSYIGFSQGSTQAFAAFASNEKLAEKIDIFIALAPAARVKQLKNPFVAAISTSRPQLVYLLFGKKILLEGAMFWRKILRPSLYVRVIDFFLDFLFGWKTKNINQEEKEILYSHLYSYSSVKCLVHWFQITHSQRFQMYDDNVSVASSKEQPYRPYLLPAYPLSKIKCPMALFYGGQDSIPDMNHLLKEVPSNTYVHQESTYEHLDFLWARTAPELIFTRIIQVLERQASINYPEYQNMNAGSQIGIETD